MYKRCVLILVCIVAISTYGQEDSYEDLVHKESLCDDHCGCNQYPRARDIPDLIEKLKNKDPDAALYLRDLGEKAASAIPDLIELLHNEDKDIRMNAAWVLGYIGQKAAPFLIEALQDKDRLVRRCAVYAVYSLMAVGAEATVISALIKALQDKDDLVRQWAMDVLGRAKAVAAVPALVKSLQDNPSDRIFALMALSKIGPGAASISIIIKFLPDKELGWSAAKALGKIGTKSAPFLIKATEHRDWRVRARAAYALAIMGEKAAPAVPALIRIFQDKESEVRIQAAEALRNIGPKAAPAIPILIKALHDKDQQMRSCAATILGSIGPKAISAIPALVKALQYKKVKTSAAFSLLEIGPKAIPPLIKALLDQDIKDKNGIAYALTIRGRQVEPVLIEILEDRDKCVRSYAAQILGDIGSKAAISALVKALQDQNQNVKKSAAQAIKKIRGW